MKRRSLALACCFALPAFAQTIVIDGLSFNGSLSWAGDPTNFTRYHVEWAPGVSGPWSASWDGLTNLAASNGMMTVAVPMLYRVVGTLAPLSGETCDNAPLIAPGSYRQSTVGYANDFDAAAQGTPAPGPDRFYRVAVPGNRILTATLTPTNAPAFDPVLLALSGAGDCPEAASNILAAADASGVAGAETIALTNLTGASLEVRLVADGFTANTAGEYELALTLTSALVGDVCATAEDIAPGNFDGLTVIDYVNDRGPGAGCAPLAGPDRFFRLTIPSGQTLTTTVTPDTAWDVSVNVVSAASACPGPAECLAGVDLAGAGAAESVQYLNSSATALEVFIVVGGFNTNDYGTFSLAAAFAP